MFDKIAPTYWAAGVPVIPLRPKSKIPAPNAWQSYKDKMPDEATQAEWLFAYPDGNVGLPLGPQSGMVAVDLDSEDPRVIAILEAAMPPSLWKRVGKKGAVYMFKFTGERTTRIKDKDNNTLVEILSAGTQVVLPPSIHPDTQKPYTANCELLSVRDQMSALPADFEVDLRKRLIAAGFELTTRGQAGVTDWVPAGSRDSTMVSIAGLNARAVTRGSRTLLEALHEMDVWLGTFTERVAGDPIEPEKARDKVMEFLRRDVVESKRPLPKGWDAGMSEAEVAAARVFFGEDVEEWPIGQLMDWIADEFTRVGPDDLPGRIEIIDGVLLRLVRSPSISEVHHDAVFNYLKLANPKTLTLASLRRRMRELDGGSDIEGTDHTEIAEAVVVEEERFGEIRFDSGAFYQWRGAHWDRRTDGEIMNSISENFGKLVAARKFSDHKGILAIIKNRVSKVLRTDDLPGINFANGYLTSDGELRAHDPKYGCTYVMPYRYVVDGPAPLRWLSLLDKIWGHAPDYPQRVQALREMMAATLFGQATSFQRAYLLFGVSHSGKSTVSEIVKGLVPDAAISTVPPTDWADRFLPTPMHGALINFCGELSERGMIAGDRFKSIVEGATMAGQFKGEQIFQFRPMCSQWFASNSLPKTHDTSGGFTRRWLIMCFERPITADEKIADYHKVILSEEREEIAAWCVPAMQDLLRNNDYTLPDSHIRQLEEVATTNNTVRAFITAGLVEVKDGVSAHERELYQAYYSYCRLQAAIQPVHLKKFQLQMAELQHEFKFLIRSERVTGGHNNFYDGLRLVPKGAAG